MEYNEFCVNMPFPEVSGAVSAQTLAAIMDAYGGRVSETTAILQYSYQHYIVHEKYPCIAEMLEKIAIVEMAHHELLAQAILTFGGDPIIAGRYAFFSGSYLNYVKNIKTALKNDIEAEQEAIYEYRRIIDSTKNESLKELLFRIIMDEELHISAFTKALSSLAEES